MRVVGYVRVSLLDQVDGYSLAAQERAIEEYCRTKGYSFIGVYRDEGVSAHSDQVEKRPGLVRLLADAQRGDFDIVVVHTLDRWARNLRVALTALAGLGAAKVGLISITEQIDYATGQGRLSLHILGAFAEFFSDNLAGHVRKARRERFELGMHNGIPPFGYAPCGCPDRLAKTHAARCAGVVVVEAEAQALGEVAARYAAGCITLAQAAAELNGRGFRTRHGKAFTSASIRFLLANPYLVGRVRARDRQTGTWQERPGLQPAILPPGIFAQIQEHKGRRERLIHPNRRVYLLKGLIACIHCGESLWSETYQNGYRYYREQRGTRQHDDCSGEGRSVRCEIIDEQAGALFGSLALPEDWREEIERRVADYERVRSVAEERDRLAERLRRLTTAYTLGNLDDDDYQRQQAAIKRQLAGLRVPEVEEAVSAGEVLADLRTLWDRATLAERHELLSGMVERVYVDLVSGRLVGVTPKPAFWTLFAQVRVENPRVLLLSAADMQRRLAENEPPIWWWWRRGRIELPVQRESVRDILRA